LTPAKSLTLRPLVIPDEYFADFFRGCVVDGDGSVVVYTDRYHTAKKPRYVYERLDVSLVSASRPFLEWAQDSVLRIAQVRGTINVRSKTGPNPVGRCGAPRRNRFESRAGCTTHRTFQHCRGSGSSPRRFSSLSPARRASAAAGEW